MANGLRRHWWLGACAALLALYAAVAWTAVSRKGATFDEPLEVVSSWAAGHLGDYRVDFEHPPLWKRWAWLGNAGGDVRADLSSVAWRTGGTDMTAKWAFTQDVMYGQRGNDPHELVRRSRAMMLVLAVAGGAVIAWWAWGVGGGVAAVVAVGLFALDPNFLGHGPLVKNDVPVAAVSAAVLAITWLLGKRVTWARAAVLAVLCGVALVVKLSALALGPIVAALLLGRAVFGGPWRVVGRDVSRRAGRIAVAGGLCLGAVVVSYGVIWASYGFRYAASPDPGFRLDTAEILHNAALKSFYRKDPARRPSEAELAAWDPGLVARAALAMNRWHALPEAWLTAVIFTRRTAAGEPSYLNGQVRFGGTWYYFLEAIAVKTPVGTLVAMPLAAAWWAMRMRRRVGGERPADTARPPIFGWDLACLIVPAAALLVGSFFAELNLGLRYVLPVYPPLFVLAGVAAAGVWAARAGRVLVVGLGVAVAAECAWAYPNYVAYFNVPSGGSRGGLALLADSNLDWGQDLPLVAEWQRLHPDVPLYLGYFGREDPASWGIRYHNAPGGFAFGPRQEWPPPAGAVIMVSATNLQGVYLGQDFYAPLRQNEPDEVLGGTIYVYRVGKE